MRHHLRHVYIKRQNLLLKELCGLQSLPDPTSTQACRLARAEEELRDICEYLARL